MNHLCFSLLLFALIGIGQCLHEALPKPTNLQFLAITDDGCKIKWDYEDDPAVYFVAKYRVEDSTKNWRLKSAAQKEILLPLGPQKHYQVAVSARKAIRIGNVEVTKKSDWTPFITVITPNRMLYDEPISPEIKAPTDLNAQIMSSTSIHLSWSPVTFANSTVFYELLYQEYLRSQNDFGPVHMMMVTSPTVSVDHLQPAMPYKFRVKAKSGEFESDPSVFVIVQTPADTEGVKIKNLRLSSHPNNPHQITLLWDVEPTTILERVVAFHILFSTTPEADRWDSVKIVGSAPTGTLTNIQPKTQYFVKIRTELSNGAISESQTFKFVTPSAVPIANLQFGVEPNGQLKLLWTLQSYVDPMTIVGYQLMYTHDVAAPIQEWNVINISGREAQSYMPELLPNVRYSVKIYPKTTSGTTLTNDAIFAFVPPAKSQSAYVDQSVDIRYRKITPNSVEITWTPPLGHENDVQSYMLLYSPDKNLRESDWMKIIITNAHRATLHVEPNIPYFIKIIPKSANGYMNGTGIYEILKPSASENLQTPISNTSSNTREIVKTVLVTMKSCRSTVDCPAGTNCIYDSATSCFGEMNICPPMGLCVSQKIINAALSSSQRRD